ncbi:hypothetical protein Y1Q_0003504 [Alligator mississippiensis]|uniref:Uncharacterized protein n=1 Tax=Alligator mississippiensis TaxID=8496 RepID=A0A151M4C0_ALLMI|nr:hypothetical protein Y1Q_0003504 [Alligator mississippiensis]
MEERDIIRFSVSPRAAPVVLVWMKGHLDGVGGLLMVFSKFSRQNSVSIFPQLNNMGIYLMACLAPINSCGCYLQDV